MAIFNPTSSSKRDTPSFPPESALKKEPDTANEFSFNPGPTPAPVAPPAPAAMKPSVAEPPLKESLIAADLSIEGKIQGAGHIRIAGRFKGDVQVEGDLTVELGAKLNGAVRARRVVIAGELEGNIESAARVELLDTGVMVGDIKAGIVTVAAGSRMRGQVEFGWDDKDAGTSAAEPANPAAKARTESGRHA